MPDAVTFGKPSEAAGSTHDRSDAPTHCWGIADNHDRDCRSGSMDLFEAMRAFVHVVESGNYTKAALLVNLHKATVSEQIQQLEDKLGTRLLTRTTRTVTPTVEGLAYYQRAGAALHTIVATVAARRHG